MDSLRTRRREGVCGRTNVTIDFTDTVTRCGVNKDRNDSQSNSDMERERATGAEMFWNLFIQEK